MAVAIPITGDEAYFYRGVGKSGLEKYNEAILDGLKFKPYNINKVWGLGTPEDLKTYLENFLS